MSTLNQSIDEEIGVLAKQESAAESPAEDTFAAGMTPEQMAMLSISFDLQSLLIKLGKVQEQISGFQTFARSLQSQINIMRGK